MLTSCNEFSCAALEQSSELPASPVETTVAVPVLPTGVGVKAVVA